jgi:hypothetical protein
MKLSADFNQQNIELAVFYIRNAPININNGIEE